jgi:ABC-type glycerol-3-phosphate transport system permease component
MGEQLPAVFDPRAIGFIEARLWQAYFARHWPRVALLASRLVREQLGLSASVTISVLPVVAAYLLLSRRFIAGLTAGSVKG